MAVDPNVARSAEETRLPGRERLKSDAAEVVDKAKQVGQRQLESGKHAAAEQTEKVAGMFEQASEQLEEGDLHSLAEYARQLGNTIKSLSKTLRNRSIDDLLQDTQGLARRNPAVFLLGSVAIGVALSRFLKASAARGRERYQREPSDQPMDPSGTMQEYRSPATIGPSLFRERV